VSGFILKASEPYPGDVPIRMAADNHRRKRQEVFRRLKSLSLQEIAIAGIHIEKGSATTAKKNHPRKQE
jgi:hypothetical protein